MKLNIEELAQVANDCADKEARKMWDWHSVRDKAFARLIVERCAGVADSMNESDWSPAQVAAAIRKLLEAE